MKINLGTGLFTNKTMEIGVRILKVFLDFLKIEVVRILALLAAFAVARDHRLDFEALEIEVVIDFVDLPNEGFRHPVGICTDDPT